MKIHCPTCDEKTKHDMEYINYRSSTDDIRTEWQCRKCIRWDRGEPIIRIFKREM